MGMDYRHRPVLKRTMIIGNIPQALPKWGTYYRLTHLIFTTILGSQNYNIHILQMRQLRPRVAEQLAQVFTVSKPDGKQVVHPRHCVLTHHTCTAQYTSH